MPLKRRAIFDLEKASKRIRRAAAVAASCAGIALLGISPAAAQSPGSSANANPLLFTIGANAVYGPRFEGSTRHDVSPWPIFSWRRANDKEWLDQPTDGLDYSLIETDNFRMGPVGFFRWQRDNGTITQRGFSRVGSGHNQIDLSLEAGIFAEYWPVKWLRTRIEVRESVLGASGTLAIFASDVVWKPMQNWTFSLGPRLTVGDSRYMNSYYGVTPAQSASTGLNTYDPGAGIRSYGIAGLARYKISQNWTTQAFFDYQHLTSTPGDSPVISSRGTTEQYLVGVGLSYTFATPW